MEATADNMPNQFINENFSLKAIKPTNAAETTMPTLNIGNKTVALNTCNALKKKNVEPKFKSPNNIPIAKLLLSKVALFFIKTMTLISIPIINAVANTTARKR